MKIKRVYDPEIEKQAAMAPHLDIANPSAARQTLVEAAKAMAAQGIKRATDDRIEEIERKIPGPEGAPDIPIRIYMPANRKSAVPCFVNFHMGGFVVGDLEMEHLRCLVMASEGGAVSIGVDYRLAPENPFPAGVLDCYEALKWAASNAAELGIDTGRIVVGGGSAGGNLAAAVSMMARDKGGPDIAYQMLFYPVTDDRCETDSMKNGKGLYVWDYENSLCMWEHYLGKDRTNVSHYAAPARANDLSGLPPAYIIACEHDALRDEGILFALQLLNAGIPVELHVYPGTVHGFDMLTMTDLSGRAIQDSVAAFKRATA
ncbi:MAG: alpha/beta hydrolase [Spirochaetes bacterium]|nr:alpha/beta hydrolase [Spirochaetota bacterium]